MTTLRRDMTRCHGVGCPLALQCLRHVAPVDPNPYCSWVASAHEPGEPTCRHLLPVPNGATP
jgi:hypothetical protein